MSSLRFSILECFIFSKPAQASKVKGERLYVNTRTKNTVAFHNKKKKKRGKHSLENKKVFQKKNATKPKTKEDSTTKAKNSNFHKTQKLLFPDS